MKYILLSLLILIMGIGTSKASNEPQEGWKITATDTTNYVGISLANGRIGLLPSAAPFKVKSIILNNVFDEYMYNKKDRLITSRVLLGINFANLKMVIDGDTITSQNISHWKQVLNMKDAKLSSSFQFNDKADISYTIYALRGMPYAGMMDVNVKALKKDIKISVSGQIICPKDYNHVVQVFKTPQDNEIRMPLLQTVALSPTGEQKLATTATFVFNNNEEPGLTESVQSPFEHSLTFSREVKSGKTFNFAWAGAVCTSKDFADPQSESERMAIYMMRGNKQAVIDQHIQLWHQLWQGDIQVEGDLESQRDIRLALYHLYAFSRDDSNLSLSPMGLSSQGYNGHVFWDTEIWMYPPLLVFNQGIARSLLNYRADRLDKAKQKASDYGYKGAMFPWESDDTGEEATPTFALTGAFEQHITADVGIAFWNYFRVTRNKDWLKDTGYPVIKATADFWASRAVENPDGSWSINNVVGADEFAPNVDDNAFTNGSAQTVMRYAEKAAELLNEKPNPQWEKVASNLRFYYFPDGVTKEHKTYNGEIIKQADVNLLAYPLQIETDTAAIRRDLAYYEPKMAKEGPAMGHSIVSILYSRLGNAEEAFRMFKKAYVPNKRPPFGALAESATSNNPYFATGAGGMLQTVIFGFAGLEITSQGIVQHTPCLPQQWKKLTITGVGPKKKTYTITHHN
ncbi:hypothetical protein PbJCM13498_09560 [Prolixibacter bellariivorans]|uniref:Glycosyl hydrolase family 65 n=1 Tax=Prolixibacter bellariivorans TaxID=314319 RepID=A0A5M4AWV6_9BACT|nr:glycoside hydrolase family 65 protein [Prolixibacter bellariivorans]GET32093.1 hypothetical protein PbJCM13498_09560 [Prolixibacter bellariivorans]